MFTQNTQAEAGRTIKGKDKERRLEVVRGTLIMLIVISNKKIGDYLAVSTLL